MIRVPKYEIIAFLEWINNIDYKERDVNIEELAKEYIYQLDNLNNFDNTIKFILNIFQSNLRNEEGNVIENIIYILRCERCLRKFLRDSVLYNDVRLNNQLSGYIQFININRGKYKFLNKLKYFRNNCKYDNEIGVYIEELIEKFRWNLLESFEDYYRSVNNFNYEDGACSLISDRYEGFAEKVDRLVSSTNDYLSNNNIYEFMVNRPNDEFDFKNIINFIESYKNDEINKEDLDMLINNFSKGNKVLEKSIKKVINYESNWTTKLQLKLALFKNIHMFTYRRYNEVKMHALLLFGNEDGFIKFMDGKWKRLDDMTQNHLDIYYSKDDLRKNITGYAIVNKIEELSTTINFEDVPCLVIWRKSLKNCRIIPLKELDDNSIMDVITGIVQKIRENQSFVEIVNRGTYIASEARIKISHRYKKEEKIVYNNTYNGPVGVGGQNNHVHNNTFNQVSFNSKQNLSNEDLIKLKAFKECLLINKEIVMNDSEKFKVVGSISEIIEAKEKNDECRTEKSIIDWNELRNRLSEGGIKALAIAADIVTLSDPILKFLGIKS
ncbi:hypothetical protein [Clostridium hydrogenum]|uniref:hypothetical protein n=1 Tax=Clostridium hydrogenum TaxID=2855764 RepID=UPI001F390D29|nr:hypothetical protein [Clostridium hydrogenum]